MAFELTHDKVRLNQHVSVISAGVSIGFCIVVLLLSLWVWSVRSARGFLDRVSFRLLLWSMFFEIVYDVNFIAVVLSASPGVTGTITRAGEIRCSVGIYFMIATLGIVNYLCTCIAVNLFITIVLGLNPIILKLERWYVGVSLFVGFFVPIIPAALGHFGLDPIFKVCWIRASNDKQRMTNFVMDLYLWQLLTCLIATVAVAATLIKLFRQGRATSRALFEGNSINLEMSGDSLDLDEKRPSKGLVSRVFHRRRQSHEKEHVFGHLEDRFIRIALRISLYPVSLIIVNGIIAIGDLYISAAGGVHSKTVYGLYCLYYFLYGARGIFFAALGLFVDPCLHRGVFAAWKATHPNRRAESHGASTGKLKAQLASSMPQVASPMASRADPLAVSTHSNGDGQSPPDGKHPLTREDSSGSMDVLQALFLSGPPEDHDHWTQEWHSQQHGAGEGDDRLRQNRHSLRAHSLPTFTMPRFLRRSSRRAASAKSDNHSNVDIEEPRLEPIIAEVENTPPPATPDGFTMTFTGVPANFLPEGMDDHAHDVVHPEALEAAEAAAAEAAAAEAARSPSIRSPIRSRGPSGAATPVLPLRRGSTVNQSASGSVRRPSLVDSLTSYNFAPRRGSTVDGLPNAPSVAFAGRHNNRLLAAQRRASSAQRSSLEGSLCPVEERRQRRERAMEIAERLYEEMEAQL